jgi:hypothetical protein
VTTTSPHAQEARGRGHGNLGKRDGKRAPIVLEQGINSDGRFSRCDTTAATRPALAHRAGMARGSFADGWIGGRDLPDRFCMGTVRKPPFMLAESGFAGSLSAVSVEGAAGEARGIAGQQE